MRGRALATTYEYDDQGRVSRTIIEPAWTEADRALLMALEVYEGTLCSGCGHPRERAWHPEMDGWYDAKHYKCAACSAMRDEPVHYTDVIDENDQPTDALPNITLEVVPPATSDSD